MNTKDYYSILGVSPSASQEMIKQAYRRLALKYHPDKNKGNSFYELRFKEINEAYRILSNNKRRINYHYSAAVSKDSTYKKYPETISTDSIVTLSKKLRTIVAASDPDRMNTLALGKQVQKLLDFNNVDIMTKMATEEEVTDFVQNLLYISRHLPYTRFREIMPILIKISKSNNDLLLTIRKTDKTIKIKTIWDKLKFLLILMLVFLFCLYIYLVGK